MLRVCILDRVLRFFLDLQVLIFYVPVWRTSTAEPTKTGIIWTALKDVSRYIPLFSKPGTLILDLNNIIAPDVGLTGEYDGV
jgi:hypothetical protein